MTTDLEDYALAIAAVGRRNSERLFYRLFPDTDRVQIDGSVIHARAKYAKHLEFFEAGAKYRERCFMAANRCLAPWTFIETEDGSALCVDIWSGAGRSVLSLVDGLRCAVQPQGGLFLGIEPSFRVVLGSGQFFDCSRRHRVLTDEGWLSLDRLVSLSDGLRCWHRREDYQASCDAGGYLGDQPLRQIAGIGLASPPSPCGAQGRGPLFFSLPDEAEPILRRIHASPRRDQFSTRDDLHRFSDLFGLFSGPSCNRPVLSLTDCTLDVLPHLFASVLRPLSAAESRPGQQLDDALRELGLTRSRDGSCRPIEPNGEHQYGWRWCDGQALGGSIQEWSRDEAHIPTFYPWSHPPLVGGGTIIAIVQLGLQPIIDAHVPMSNNYLAAGVFHHNTGKTLGAGGYETAAHLTGEYPKWWPGRRFNQPVRWWGAGKINETTRDIVQATLLGQVTRDGRKHFDGTGVIPGDSLGPVTWKQGVSDLVDTIKVRHVSGGWSILGFKSYNQGRGSFEGTAQHGIWLDEEPPLDVYGECLIRTATTDGIIMLTFTPLDGLSEVVMSFLPEDMAGPATPGDFQ